MIFSSKNGFSLILDVQGRREIDDFSDIPKFQPPSPILVRFLFYLFNEVRISKILFENNENFMFWAISRSEKVRKGRIYEFLLPEKARIMGNMKSELLKGGMETLNTSL